MTIKREMDLEDKNYIPPKSEDEDQEVNDPIAEAKTLWNLILLCRLWRMRQHEPTKPDMSQGSRQRHQRIPRV